MNITFTVNNQTIQLEAEPETPLLYILRNDLQLNGPRFGCGLAQCGACTVLLDGRPIHSCVTTLAAVQNKQVTTLEGLGDAEKPHPLQQAFIEEQAMQCGYCSNSMIMAAAALLAENTLPSDMQIRQALDNYLCRCGSHNRIVRAVKRAAAMLQESQQ